MKRAKKCIVFTTILAAVLFFAGFIGDSSLTAQSPAAKSQNIQTFVLDSFEEPGSWRADFSLFAAKRYNSGSKKYEMDTEKCTWTNFQHKPWGVVTTGGSKSPDDNTGNCLGVKATFDRRGYNWIEVYPVSKDADGKLVHKPLPMRGKVTGIDLWVWGGNFEYRLELHLRDYLEYTHVIDAGWLNYVGWRNIRLRIPEYIPQGEKYVPAFKVLRLDKFVLVSHPGERPDNFYVFFDHMQIQTDIHVERFDGDELVETGFESGWMPKQETMK